VKPSNQPASPEEIRSFFRRLDRTLFLEPDTIGDSWQDRPLPIGKGQTISQPSLVLQMTILLEPAPSFRVLEIGTGSGYQTAFLAEFFGEVFTVERFPQFVQKARERIQNLGYQNVHFRTGDGCEGWQEASPFERIVVTAGAGKPPPPLLQQLKIGGFLLIPVGNYRYQVLKKISRTGKDTFTEKDIEEVRFVELAGPYGFDSWQPS